jgi:hypothetical protein
VKRTSLWIGLAAAVFVALVIYSTLDLKRVRYEVCMEFNGRTACRIAGGETPERARRAAIDNACALISSGVGDSIACQNKPPVSERKLD